MKKVTGKNRNLEGCDGGAGKGMKKGRDGKMAGLELVKGDENS